MRKAVHSLGLKMSLTFTMAQEAPSPYCGKTQMRIVISLKSGFQVIHQTISIFLSITKFAFAFHICKFHNCLVPLQTFSSHVFPPASRQEHLLHSESAHSYPAALSPSLQPALAVKHMFKALYKERKPADCQSNSRNDTRQTRLYTFSHPYLSPQFLFFGCHFFFWHLVSLDVFSIRFFFLSPSSNFYV